MAKPKKGNYGSPVSNQLHKELALAMLWSSGKTPEDKDPGEQYKETNHGQRVTKLYKINKHPFRDITENQNKKRKREELEDIEDQEIIIYKDSQGNIKSIRKEKNGGGGRENKKLKTISISNTPNQTRMKAIIVKDKKEDRGKAEEINAEPLEDHSRRYWCEICEKQLRWRHIYRLIRQREPNARNAKYKWKTAIQWGTTWA